MYFSFATLTTVGYGDLTAQSNLGHSLSDAEALVGGARSCPTRANPAPKRSLVIHPAHARSQPKRFTFTWVNEPQTRVLVRSNRRLVPVTV